MFPEFPQECPSLLHAHHTFGDSYLLGFSEAMAMPQTSLFCYDVAVAQSSTTRFHSFSSSLLSSEHVPHLPVLWCVPVLLVLSPSLWGQLCRGRSVWARAIHLCKSVTFTLKQCMNVFPPVGLHFGRRETLSTMSPNQGTETWKKSQLTHLISAWDTPYPIWSSV